MPKIRIYQIAFTQRQNIFTPLSSWPDETPDSSVYRLVFDGDVGTGDLSEIYRIFNLNHPTSFTGHSLSVSDIVSIDQPDATRSYYCEPIGWQEVDFDETSTCRAEPVLAVYAEADGPIRKVQVLGDLRAFADVLGSGAVTVTKRDGFTRLTNPKADRALYIGGSIDDIRSLTPEQASEIRRQRIPCIPPFSRHIEY